MLKCFEVIKLEILSPKQKEILKAFSNYYKENDEFPSLEIIKTNHDLPSTNQIYKYFKGIPQIKELLHLPTKNELLRQELINAIHKYVEEFKEPPHIYTFSSRRRIKGYPREEKFKRIFTSVEHAILEAGYEPLRDTNFWTKEKVIDEGKKNIEYLISKTGQIPTRKIWDDKKMVPSRGTIKKHTDFSFNEFLDSLGYSPIYESSNHHTKDELISILQTIHQTTGKTPTADYLREHVDKYPNPITFQRRFGTFNGAIVTAGLVSNKEYTEQYLLDKILEYSKNVGHIPTTVELATVDGLPTKKPFERLYGSYNNFLLHYGIDLPSTLNRKSYGQHTLAKDGHFCDSVAEAIVDNFFFENDIEHQKDNRLLHYPYHDLYNPNNAKRCDFIITNKNSEKVYVEYAGMMNKTSYKNAFKIKVKMCEELGLQLIIIYPEDLKNLKAIFKNFINI